MNEQLTADTRVFRAGKHMLVVIGILSGLMIALAFGPVVRCGDWNGVAFTATASLIVFALTLPLRLEIGPQGLRYRDVTGSRSIDFASLTRAYIEVVRRPKAPQGVATFWLEFRENRRWKLGLRLFPVEAAALLFTVLEARNIPIEVPDEWAAQQVAKQVRAAQSNLAK